MLHSGNCRLKKLLLINSQCGKLLRDGFNSHDPNPSRVDFCENLSVFLLDIMSNINDTTNN